MSYGDSCSHPSGYEQGNTGYSGTPLWKIRQQMEAARQISLVLPKEKFETDAPSVKCPRLLTDAVVLCDEQAPKKPQPGARHVLVRDLRKVAQVLKIALPTQGIFEDSSGLVRCSLCALCDGQCKESSGSSAKVAEFYCRNLPAKLLGNLSIIPAERCNQVFMQSALLKTFEDLEADAARAPGGAAGGTCAAAVALVIGNWLFTAVLGRCSAVLCRVEGEPLEAADYVATELGGRRRGPAGGSLDSGVPEVSAHQMDLDGGRRQRLPFVMLTSACVADALPVREQMGLAVEYGVRPRAASGGIAALAVERLRSTEAAKAGAGPPLDCAVIVSYFAEASPAGGPVAAGGSGAAAASEQPAAKRARVDGQALQSVRLRHILVRHRDSKHPMDPVKHQVVKRSRAEAEALLRGALAELMKDGDHRGDSMWAAKSTPAITGVCKNTSECKSALKGGTMCGDLGWLGKKELQALGKDTEEAVRAMGIAEWSDLLASEQGVHLMMRIA